MKCLILAAGYATRLYPLTKNFPKPLLEVKKKTIIDRLVDDLAINEKIDEFIVVSNHKFAHFFEEWAEKKEIDKKITVMDDMTESNETRLGAVKDISFVIDALEITDDLIVLAGDNILDFSLNQFVDYAVKKDATCVLRYFEPDKEKIKKSACIVADENDLILDMEEKPETPKSNYCCPPFYFYNRRDVSMVKEGIKRGCKTDAPGSFIAWLCKETEVYAMEMPGKRYDVGTLEDYERFNRE